MKYKIIFGLALLIFLIAQAKAVVITQTQLDNVNATSFNLQCQRELVSGQNYTTTNNYFKIGVSCLTIKPLENSTYEVARKTFYPRFRITDYFSCVNENGRTVCLVLFRNILQNQIDLFKQNQRERIEHFQNQDEATIGQEFGGFSPSP